SYITIQFLYPMRHIFVIIMMNRTWYLTNWSKQKENINHFLSMCPPFWYRVTLPRRSRAL
ncbi:hypothetical protein L9F63_011958, partial [Diploptera punctata]